MKTTQVNRARSLKSQEDMVGTTRITAGLLAGVLAVSATRGVQLAAPSVAEHLRSGASTVKDIASTLGRNVNVGHEFSQEELSKMPQVQVKAELGDGIDDEIFSVDPQLQGAHQGLADVEAYVKAQGVGPNHQLQENQQVLVPQVPAK